MRYAKSQGVERKISEQISLGVQRLREAIVKCNKRRKTEFSPSGTRSRVPVGWEVGGGDTATGKCLNWFMKVWRVLLKCSLLFSISVGEALMTERVLHQLAKNRTKQSNITDGPVSLPDTSRVQRPSSLAWKKQQPWTFRKMTPKFQKVLGQMNDDESGTQNIVLTERSTSNTKTSCQAPGRQRCR